MPGPRQTPYYALADVQRDTKTARIGRRVVIRTSNDYPVDDPAVDLFIRSVIRSLKPDDFVESKDQQYPNEPPIPADVYGVVNGEGAWYVKFSMEDGRVTVLSCHSPDHNIVRANGTTIRIKP
jgi:hypothetical protein